MSQLKALDCQSFAGGFTLAVAQTGFELVGKREDVGGFGVAAVEANRHLIPGDWVAEAGSPETWTPLKADLVFGNPPCSGFSQRSAYIKQTLEDGTIGRVNYRGVDAAPNKCMWDLIRFAAKCDPDIVIFESVQGAYNRGRDLMQALRKELETLTGSEYTLFHALHNNAALGGAQARPRYFWVASRIPFGVHRPKIDRVTTVRDRIEELASVELGSMDGHVVEDTPRGRRVAELASAVEWQPGEVSGSAYMRAVEQGASLPAWEDDLKSDKGVTQFAPRRMVYDKPARVLAGDALWNPVHPTLPRTLTHREVARLMGYPDDWTCEPYLERRDRSYWWGKGICIESGRWIAGSAKDALEGNPAPYKGELIGEREYLIDQTKDDQDAQELPFEIAV